MSKLKQIVCLILLFLCCVAVRADWKKVNSGTFAWLHSIYFINQNQGWIVGSKGTFLETKDGGSTWNAVKLFSQDTIRDIYFTDEKHGWILAERDIFSTGGISPSYILETFDGGQNWQNVSLEGAGNERLVKIFFSQDGFGYAVGEAGTFYAMQNNKDSWKRNNLPIRFLLLDGSFFNQYNGLVVGGGGSALFTEDGGNTWTSANFTNKSKGKLNSVFFINRQVGWAVGADGKIFTTVNGGKFWREQNSKVTQDLFDVFFVNTAEGWAIGDSGIILETKTAGNIWSPIQTSARHKLERVFFIGKIGFVVGFGGTILKYEVPGSDKKENLPAPLLQKRN